jgi:hypothetical protein
LILYLNLLKNIKKLIENINSSLSKLQRNY